MAYKRYLPSDVSSDIHQMIAKAIFLRDMVAGGGIRLSRTELERAAAAEFEYDLTPDGALLFRIARN